MIRVDFSQIYFHRIKSIIINPKNKRGNSTKISGVSPCGVRIYGQLINSLSFRVIEASVRNRKECYAFQGKDWAYILTHDE